MAQFKPGDHESKPIAAGEYSGEIVDLTQDESTKKNTPYYAVVFEILGGSEDGKRITYNAWLTEKAFTMLANFVIACGVGKDDQWDIDDPDATFLKLRGLRAKLLIKHETSKSGMEYAVIEQVKPLKPEEKNALRSISKRFLESRSKDKDYEKINKYVDELEKGHTGGTDSASVGGAGASSVGDEDIPF